MFFQKHLQRLLVRQHGRFRFQPAPQLEVVLFGLDAIFCDSLVVRSGRQFVAQTDRESVKLIKQGSNFVGLLIVGNDMDKIRLQLRHCLPGDSRSIRIHLLFDLQIVLLHGRQLIAYGVAVGIPLLVFVQHRPQRFQQRCDFLQIIGQSVGLLRFVHGLFQ